MKRLAHIYTTTVIFLSMSTVSMAGNGYATDLLGKMAAAMNVTQELDTLGDGCYYRGFTYNGRPVSVEVRQGNVTHIGYSLFSKGQKDFLQSPVCNFLERYSLEITLPMQHKKGVVNQLEEDGIFFRRGSFSLFRQIEQDTTYAVGIENLNDKRYTVSWSKDGAEFLSINLPIEYDLLAGCDMIEREKRLTEGVQNTPQKCQWPTAPVDSAALQQSWQGKYYILKGEIYYLPQLNSNRYYVKEQEEESVSYQLLYDTDFVAESLANLFTTVEIPNDYTMELRIRKYGFKTDTIHVALNQWTMYCLNEGCVPYFGVEENAKEVVCEIVMLNKAMGYCHLVRAVVDSEDMGERNGVIKARVVTYIPVSRIKYLFEELKI